MNNLWNDQEAQSYISRYAEQGCNADLALRVYTTQLLGRDTNLVLHGGGNSSVKTTLHELTGEPVEVLCVKGSGWDMDTIEPAGLPAVRMAPLLKLLALDALTDEDMVNAQRQALLQCASPNPSVETLLHAFLPEKFIDHTHSSAILSVTNQANGEQLVRDLFGDRVGIVPYIMPGFDLAKAAYEVYQANPKVEGLILLKHGIFTFGESAKQAYDRMIQLVTEAEALIAEYPAKIFDSSTAALQSELSVAEVAATIRGALSSVDDDGVAQTWLLEHRANDDILNYVNGDAIADYSQRGVATPDHVIRTKQKPLVLPFPDGSLQSFKAAVEQAVATYSSEYEGYFRLHNERLGGTKVPLDPLPRVVMVPGFGVFGVGATRKAAKIAADITENSIQTIVNAERLGTFESINDADTFDMEYWSLEQAKLGKKAPLPLEGKVAVVSGGAGTIGQAIAKQLIQAGSEVVLLDLDGENGASAASALGSQCGFIQTDLTNEQAVDGAMMEVAATYGGVDIVVSNVGAAFQGAIGELPTDTLKRSFDLNFFAHQFLAQSAVKVMRWHGTGGSLLFNVSKQAVNPGKSFGAYGLPKAATLFLMRQYALDHGAEGIQSNGVNADRIRSGLLTDELIKERSSARGVSEAEYMAGNLLQREVKADDVAKAFLDLALARKTTGCVVTVDGGNISAALR